MDKSKKSYKKKKAKRLNNFKQKVKKYMEQKEKTQIGLQLAPDAKVTLEAAEINALLNFAENFRPLIMLADIVKHKSIENGGLKPVYKEDLEDKPKIQMEKESKIVDMNGDKYESGIDPVPTVAEEAPIGNA